MTNMAKISLYLDKTPEQNAALYFEKAKKCKKKIEGARKVLEQNLIRLEHLQKEKIKEEIEAEKKKNVKKKEKQWYDKFHWFVSSEGFMVIGGRDATTNEIAIKKHMNSDDLVFHTDIQGSPFFVIKAEGKEIGKDTIEETAQATACYSKGWKLGYSSLEVFYVKPEQVSKEAKSGEYLVKGAFIINGKTTKITPDLKLAVGIKEDGTLIGGPVNAIKKNAEKVLIVEKGDKKPSEVAKLISKKLNYNDIDEIIRFLPSGNCMVKS